MDSTSRQSTRSRRFLAAVSTSLLVTLMFTPSATAARTTLPPQGPSRPARAGHLALAPIPHAAALASAQTRARATGRPAVVGAATTATSITVANPDGSFTNTVSAQPARVLKHGRWVPVSARLVRGPGGWRPAAATSLVVFSAGGDGPLAVLYGTGRQRLALRFPGRLPTPVVNGASATYRSVRPGIDLRLTASVLGGLSQTLIVRTRTAAASAWLRHFTENYAAAGRRLVTEGPPTLSGPLRTRAADSPRGASYPDAPAGYGTVAVGGQRIAFKLGGEPLAPGAALPVSVVTSFGAAEATANRTRGTAAPDATFPSPKTVSADGYVEAQDVGGTTGCSTFMNWESKSVTQLGIGYNAWDSCMGIYQSYYRFDVSGISSSWIIEHMELHLLEVQGSWNSCSGSAEPVYLHSLGGGTSIGSDTDGANVSQLGTTSGSNKLTLPPAANPISGSTCPNRPAVFDVTSDAAGIQASSHYWTYGISGDDSDNVDGGQFMRFADDPTLVTTFDEYPPNPTMEQSSPEMVDDPSTPDGNLGCATGGNGFNPKIPWIGASSSIELAADFEASLSGELVQPGWDIWNQSATVINKTFPNTGAGLSFQQINSPVDGDEYFTLVRTTVNGNGDQNNYDPGYTSGNAECSFAVDATPPTVPAVTSTAFPAAGSGSTTTQTAPGASGPFSFSASDPPATGCAASNAIANAGYDGNVAGCLASGAYEFEYSLNQPLPSGSVLPVTTSCPSGGQTQGAVAAVNPTGNPSTSPTANPSATTTGTSCDIDVSQWGTNILYVAAVDTAGNVSQTYQYEFYVPWNSQATVTPGDVNGDGVPDLLATTSTGNLVLYPGGQDPALGPSIASTTADAPAGVPWNDLDITHRGSWSAGSVDDLFALDPSLGDLWRYTSSGTPAGMFAQTQNIHPIFFPACTAIPPGEGNQSNCSGYPAAGSGWSAFSQILAPGDAWSAASSQGPGIDQDTTQPSLLGVTTSGALWLFQGSGGELQNPVQLGASGWNDVTLMAPGDVDGQDTLWARINTGTDAGDIVSFPIYEPSGQAPTLDQSSPGTLVSPTSGTVLTAGGAPIQVPAATFPTVASTSALTGGTCSASDATACPGFYAADTTGGLWYYPGQPATSPATALTGGSQLVGGVDNAQFAWSLADGSGTMATDSTGGGDPGTLSGGVSWVTDPRRGVVASFDGSTGQIQASRAILSIRPGFSWSVSAWVDPQASGAYMDAVSQNGQNVSGFHLDMTGAGYWGFRRPFTDVAAPQYADAISSTKAQLNTWTFLTATFDGNTGDMDLYVNGQLAATANDPTPFSTPGPTAVGRGYFAATNADWWNGEISSVEGFGYALTPAEVETLYAGNGQTLLTQLS